MPLPSIEENSETGFLPNATQTISTSNTAAVTEYGAIMPIISADGMPVNAFRYRLCALPIGVNILPTFAPTVINVPTSTACSSIWAMVSTAIANGMNVTNATSLVISMPEKYVSEISVITNPRAVPT